MNLRNVILAAGLAVAATGCRSCAARAEVKCFSGGQVVFHEKGNAFVTGGKYNADTIHFYYPDGRSKQLLGDCEIEWNP